MVVANVPGDVLGVWPRLFIVVLLALFVSSSLATTEIIPWGDRSWTQWRKPKVLGSVVYLLLGAGGFVAGTATIFNPPAAEQKTLLQTQKTARATEAKVDAISALLQKRFPDAPPVLKEIEGRWGDLNPACEVVWNIRVIQRGNNAALLAETSTIPKDIKPYRFVGEIVAAEGAVLRVEGVEPATARGASARFEINLATQQLTWDDRARGSGGVEIYRRCP